MNWIFRNLRIHSEREVLRYTLIGTAISVFSPVFVLSVVMLSLGAKMNLAVWVIAVCTAIPLLIAPPITYFCLSMFRMLTLTIEKVDTYVRVDTLTGVSTRASFFGRVRESLSAGGIFLMADADHFKSVNDTYGHDVGDAALKLIAETMSRQLPYNAVIGRLGGEEFGIFLNGTNAEQAAAAAERLCEAVRSVPLATPDNEIRLTISIGCAVHEPGNTLERTMKLADLALYQAKRAGRDRYEFSSAAAMQPPRHPTRFSGKTGI